MITVTENFDIRHCNTFGIDVSCRRWVEYDSPSDLWQIGDMAGEPRTMCIGEGSNLLFTGDFDGTLLHSRILGIEATVEHSGDMLVTAGSGVKFDDLIEHTCACGRSGLENLTDIPGQVGASAVQNIGAYGVEAKDVIDSVECYDTAARKIVRLSASDCHFAYRDSLFKHERGRFIVTSVTFRLHKDATPAVGYGNLSAALGDEPPTPANIRRVVREIRASKLPPLPQVGSAGSFFKNPVVDAAKFEAVRTIASAMAGQAVTVPHYPLPGGEVKIPAAWLIERCGWKGYRDGNAAVWEKQPLIIVNLGGATPDEILRLERKVTESVESTFGIHLSPEVDHV